MLYTVVAHNTVVVIMNIVAAYNGTCSRIQLDRISVIAITRARLFYVGELIIKNIQAGTKLHTVSITTTEQRVLYGNTDRLCRGVRHVDTCRLTRATGVTYIVERIMINQDIG